MLGNRGSAAKDGCFLTRDGRYVDCKEMGKRVQLNWVRGMTGA